MQAVENTGSIVAEPDWESIFSDELDIGHAKEHWRVITTELSDRQLLSMANGHALQRLVMAYIVYDKAANEVAEHGAVSKPKKGNSRAIARVSPNFQVMREMANDAATLEAEFGLAPRRRAAAKKAELNKKVPRKADVYLIKKPGAQG
jgi:P27 family predicted phage terminase small subunit